MTPWIVFASCMLLQPYFMESWALWSIGAVFESPGQSAMIKWKVQRLVLLRRGMGCPSFGHLSEGRTGPLVGRVCALPSSSMWIWYSSSLFSLPPGWQCSTISENVCNVRDSSPCLMPFPVRLNRLQRLYDQAQTSLVLWPFLLLWLVNGVDFFF